MKKLLQRTTCFVVAMQMTGFATPAKAAPPASSVADRLVVSVSGSTYSQRHVTSWFLVRELLQESAAQTSAQKEKATRPPFLEEVAASWKDVLQKFSEDMVIRQEAARLGSFQPSAKSIMKATERIRARRAVDPQLAAGVSAIEMDEDEIARFAATILQIEGFRKSRERQLSAVTRDPSSQASGWLTELRTRAVVRVYEGGDSWVPLDFKGRKRD
jgi:transcriptional regulator of acetoin/glycerol metabolism